MSACTTTATPESPAAAPLSPLQTQAAIALARGAAISVAAASIGVHRSTIYNWFKTDPHFRSAVTEIQRESRRRILDEMHELESLALDTLRELLQSDSASAGVRLRAALQVLNRPRNCFGKDEWSLPLPEDFAQALHREPELAEAPQFDVIRQNSTPDDSFARSFDEQFQLQIEAIDCESASPSPAAAAAEQEDQDIAPEDDLYDAEEDDAEEDDAEEDDAEEDDDEEDDDEEDDEEQSLDPEAEAERLEYIARALAANAAAAARYDKIRQNSTSRSDFHPPSQQKQVPLQPDVPLLPGPQVQRQDC